MVPDFCKSIDFWKLPRVGLFVRLVRGKMQMKRGGALVEGNWREETNVFWERYVPVPICPPPISRGLTWDRIRAFAVRGWRLTAWLIIRPVSRPWFHLHLYLRIQPVPRGKHSTLPWQKQSLDSLKGCNPTLLWKSYETKMHSVGRVYPFWLWDLVVHIVTTELLIVNDGFDAHQAS